MVTRVRGKVNFRDLGLSKQPEAGQKLEDPYFEMTMLFKVSNQKADVLHMEAPLSVTVTGMILSKTLTGNKKISEGT